MAKILITPFDGSPKFKLEGEIDVRIFQNGGKIFYIRDRVFPGKTVTILEGKIRNTEYIQ